MIQQLRIDEIFERNKAAFHNRFRDHAARITRTKYGFRIVAMWETKFGDRTELALSVGMARRGDQDGGMVGLHGGLRMVRYQARDACGARTDGRPDRGSLAGAGELFAGERGIENPASGGRILLL